MSINSSPDISSLLQSLQTGALPSQSGPIGAQMAPAPSLADIISQLIGQPSVSSGTMGAAPAQPQQIGPIPNTSDQIMALMSNMKLGASPQTVLPTAGALSDQQFMQIPQGIQQMMSQQKQQPLGAK